MPTLAERPLFGRPSFAQSRISNRRIFSVYPEVQSHLDLSLHHTVASMDCVIPEDVLHSARMSSDELKQEIAVLLFRKERLTLGQASRLADMPIADFQHLLASHNIGPHYDVNDLEDDVETLRTLGRL